MPKYPTTEAELSPADREALELAIELTRRDAKRREQVEEKLREEGWLETALFCCYGQQTKNLKLAPWQPAPLQVSPNDTDGKGGAVMGRAAAASLLRKMLARGISKY